MRQLKEENLKKEYLLNLLQLNNQLEENKKRILLNYLNIIPNQNQINNGNNNLPNLFNNNFQNLGNNNILINDNQNELLAMQRENLKNQLYRQLINNQLLNQDN